MYVGRGLGPAVAGLQRRCGSFDAPPACSGRQRKNRLVLLVILSGVRQHGVEESVLFVLRDGPFGFAQGDGDNLKAFGFECHPEWRALARNRRIRTLRFKGRALRRACGLLRATEGTWGLILSKMAGRESSLPAIDARDYGLPRAATPPSQ